MRHAGQAFVFVPDTGGGFRRVDVVVGDEAQGYVEVKSGLRAGQEVVVEGAFLLKSELLLEQEEGAAG